MANKYWVGGSGNWSDATNHWALSSGGAPGAGNLPTAIDDVFFDSASNGSGYTVTIDATTKLCRDLTFAAPATGNVTWAGSVAMTISGSLTLYAGLVRTYSGTLTFNATSTGKTITCAGVSIAGSAVVFNGVGGGWTLQDSFTTSSFTLTAGSLDTNGKTVSTGTVNCSGSGVRALTLGATSWAMAGSWDFSSVTNFTFNAGTSTITMTGTATFSGGGKTFYNVVFTSGNPTISGVNTFTSISHTGAATKTDNIKFSANQTIGTLTVNGNSSVNRVLISSDIVGTSRTLTVATVAITNSDISDITGAGAGSWNLSAVTGGSGDCGGNSGITFTTGANQYFKAGTSQNWSTAGNWYLATNGGGGAGRVPLPQDTAIFDANSITAGSVVITQDMSRMGGVNWTGVTNTPTWTTSTTASVFGSITLVSGMTITGSTNTYTLAGRSTYTITSGGKTWAKQFIIDCVGGTYTLQDAFVTTADFTLSSGTFNANNNNVTLSTLTLTNNVARTLTMGSGTWTITGNAGTVINVNTTTNLTINGDTSILDLTYSGSSSTRTIDMGSQGTVQTGRFNTLKISAGTDIVSFVGANTGIYVTDMNFTGFAGTWSGSAPLNVFGSFTLVTGITRTYTGTIVFSATSTGKTFTTGGVTLSSPLNFNGVGGGWTQMSNLNTSGQTITLTNGALDTNGFTWAITNFSSSNTNTRSLTLGSSTINLNNWNTGTNTGFTLNAGTSTIAMANSASTILAGPAGLTGLTFNIVTVALVDSITLQGINTYATFTSTKDATANSGVILLTDNQTVSGTATISGNSFAVRTFVRSNVVGTNKTLSAAVLVTTYSDWREITAGGAANWNLSAITGGSGDCGGNSGITFTTAANQYYKTGVSSNYSDTSKWFLATNGGGGAGRIPLPQDTAFFDANSITAGSVTITQDMFRLGANIFTGVTNSPVFAGAASIELHGSLTLTAGMSLSGTGAWAWRGDKAVVITSAGNVFGRGITFRMSATGSVTLADNYATTSSTSITSGIFNAATFNLSSLSFIISASISRSISMGTGTWTATGTGTVWNATDITALTLTPSTSTLIFNDVSTTAKSFVGGGATYGKVRFAADNITITGSNTFSTLEINTAALTNGLKVTSGTNQTITNTVSTNASSGNLAKLVSSSAGVPFTITKTTGIVSLDYMSIKDSTATGGATFYAGSHSTDVSGNSGWNFSDAPSTAQKTINGLARASVKTFDGLAIASVKSINGVL